MPMLSAADNTTALILAFGLITCSTWCNSFSAINSMLSCLEMITKPPVIMAFMFIRFSVL